jgi:hypothetical protein
MSYRFRAAESFWSSWSSYRKSSSERLGSRFRFSRGDPFDPRLRAHKIHRLSARYGRTIYAVDIAGDLRATFYVDGATVWTVAIGTHDLYRG